MSTIDPLSMRVRIAAQLLAGMPFSPLRSPAITNAVQSADEQRALCQSALALADLLIEEACK